MNTSSCMFWICCSALRLMLTESRLCRLLFSCKTGGKIKHRSSVTLLSITLLQPSLSPIKSIQTSETPATVAQKTQVSLNQCGSHLWQTRSPDVFVIVIGRDQTCLWEATTWINLYRAVLLTGYNTLGGPSSPKCPIHLSSTLSFSHTFSPSGSCQKTLSRLWNQLISCCVLIALWEKTNKKDVIRPRIVSQMYRPKINRLSSQGLGQCWKSPLTMALLPRKTSQECS